MREKLRGQAGFTLPEVLVSMVMMSLVLFGLYAMFDAAVRVFDAGGEATAAVQDARQGLARMEREIRAAYPQDRAGGNTTLLAEFRPDRLTFGNDVGEDDDRGEDLGGNRRVIDPSTGAFEKGEKIFYATNSSGLPVRNGVRMARHAKDVDGDGRALTFEYLNAQGVPVIDGDEREVALVKVRLEVSVDRTPGGKPEERALSTTVALRNR